MSDVVILLILMLVNGFFVMSEIALVSVRKSKLEAQASKGDEQAKNALDLVDNPDTFLSTIQTAITLISIVTGVFSGNRLGQYLEPFFERFDLTKEYAESLSQTTVILLVTFFSIVIGELIPKNMGLNNAEKISKTVAAPMKLLSYIFYPFVWLLNVVTNFLLRVFKINKTSDNFITEDEIKAILSESSEGGEIDEDERDIIERVFHLGDRSITSLMTHRTDIEWFDEDDTLDDVREKNKELPYSSYPVCHKSIDHIKGIVQAKDLLKTPSTTTMKEVMRTAIFVPENNSAYQVLERMKSSKNHAAFIVNEYGTLEGMLTLTDIMSAVIGDVPQTDQDEYEIVKRDDGSYLVDAQIHFYDFLSYFDKADWANKDDQEFDTVAGFVLHELKHIPQVGEKFNWRDFTFEVIDMDGQRIDKVLVHISDELKKEMQENEAGETSSTNS